MVVAVTKIDQHDRPLTTRMFRRDIAARVAAGLDEVVAEPREPRRPRQRRPCNTIKPPAVVMPPVPIAEALAAPIAPAPLVLRPDQERLIEEIRGALRSHMRVMAQAPTAFGKGVVIGFMVKAAAAKGRRVLILGHKIEIITQLSANLSTLGITHGIIAPGHPATDCPIQLGMIATVARRIGQYEKFGVVLIDECHHVVAKSWRDVVEAFAGAFIIGFSATPTRLDGRGLDDVFDALVVGPGTAELIAAGILSRYVLFAPREAVDLTDVPKRMGDYAVAPLAKVMSRTIIVQSGVDEYERICPGATAVCFCVDVPHSKLMEETFLQRGWRAAHVDGTTPKAERKRLVAALANGDLDIICSVNLFSEGVDLPSVTAAIMLRPTASVALFLQQVGRVLRVAPGKSEAIVLDLASNFFAPRFTRHASQMVAGRYAEGRARATGTRFAIASLPIMRRDQRARHTKLPVWCRTHTDADRASRHRDGFGSSGSATPARTRRVVVFAMHRMGRHRRGAASDDSDGARISAGLDFPSASRGKSKTTICRRLGMATLLIFAKNAKRGWQRKAKPATPAKVHVFPVPHARMVENVAREMCRRGLCAGAGLPSDRAEQALIEHLEIEWGRLAEYGADEAEMIRECRAFGRAAWAAASPKKYLENEGVA